MARYTEDGIRNCKKIICQIAANYLGKMIALICVLALLSGCATAPPQGSTDPNANAAQNVEGKLVLDEADMTLHNISASEGGCISVTNGEGRFDIIFSQGSVENDSTFEVAPIKRLPGSDYLSTGFYLTDSSSGEGVILKTPASICFTSSTQIPENTMIVKLHEADGGYTIMPTRRISINGMQGLIAMVEGFSGYGVKTLTQGEIDSMADDLVKKGFDWVLAADDDFLRVTTGIDAGAITFAAHLNMNLENTQGTDAWLMQGPYDGSASLSVGIDISIEGENFYSDFQGETISASCILYPVPKVYPSVNGGPELVGLVPEYYIGSGTLHFKWSHVQSDKSGTDVIDMETMLGMYGALSDQAVSFSVITSGPFALITLLDFNNMGPIEFEGIIVGHARGPSEAKPAPTLEALDLSERYQEDLRKAQMKTNPDGSVSLDTNGDGKTDMTVTLGEDGYYEYDLNGDGVRDLELAPLEVKK